MLIAKENQDEGFNGGGGIILLLNYHNHHHHFLDNTVTINLSVSKTC